MFKKQEAHSLLRRYLRNGLAVGAGMLLTVAPPAEATFIVNGNQADQATFLAIINADTVGGTWGYINNNQLRFTDNANVPDNNYANQLNALNSVNNPQGTINVMQSAPGVLVGAFGPTYVPALQPRVQVIDLGDIQAFTANGAAQVQPLLSTRGSVLLHELAELNNDGGAANIANAHNAGIAMENNIMASQGVLGMRLAGAGTWTVNPAAPGANFATFRLTVPFQTTAAIPAAGGQAALANGARYDERIDGRIIGAAAPFSFDITNIARGLIDTGLSYDGTGYDVVIDSVTVQIVPAPSSLALLGLGLAALTVVTWRRDRRA